MSADILSHDEEPQVPRQKGFQPFLAGRRRSGRRDDEDDDDDNDEEEDERTDGRTDGGHLRPPIAKTIN